MKNLLLLLSLSFTILIISSVEKDGSTKQETCTAAAAKQGAADAFAAVEVAIGNYADTPSAENYHIFKSKAQQYVSVLKCFEHCPGVGDTREWQENIQQVEAEIALIHLWQDLP